MNTTILLILLLSFCSFADQKGTQAGVLEVHHFSSKNLPLQVTLNGRIFAPNYLSCGESTGVRFVHAGTLKVLLTAENKRISFSKTVSIKHREFLKLILFDQYNRTKDKWETELILFKASKPFNRKERSASLTLLNLTDNEQTLYLDQNAFQLKPEQRKRVAVSLEKEIIVYTEHQRLPSFGMERGEQVYVILLDHYTARADHSSSLNLVSFPEVIIPKGLRSDLTFGPKRSTIRQH